MTNPDSPTPTSSTIVDSPIGPLTLVATDRGLREIKWPHDAADAQPAVAEPSDHRVLADAAEQLDEYFAGERNDFDVDLDPVGTEFQRAAWIALTTIPYGETVTYGEQAERMGDRNKARAVGAANGKNPIPIVVPCHRVVGADGSLTGFAGGLDIKRFLLDLEAGRAPLPLEY